MPRVIDEDDSGAHERNSQKTQRLFEDFYGFLGFLEASFPPQIFKVRGGEILTLRCVCIARARLSQALCKKQVGRPTWVTKVQSFASIYVRI